MVVRIKNTRFDDRVTNAFNRVIRGSLAKLDDLKEVPEDDDWFADDHRVPLKRLLARYGSNIGKGLDPTQVVHNRCKYGSNIFAPKTSSYSYSEGKKVIKSFFLGLNTLIWLCAILSLCTAGIRYFTDRHHYDAELLFGTALIVVTIISGVSFYYQEYKSSRIIESFNEMMTPHFAMVKRDGHFKELFVDELVVGDIVKLTYGDVIPADIRLIECNEFYVDNSSLTGESDPKRRSSMCTGNDPMETKNLVFYSTHAVEGHAKGVVVAVGPNTVMGKLVELAGSVEGSKTKSPIVNEIEWLIKCISMRSLIIGCIFYIVAIILGFSWQDCISFFTEIIVASVPEGLNLSCTMLLLLMASRMAKKNCLVRNLHALETLGSSAVILTDKTGTLTQNKMSVAHLWFDDRTAEADTSEFVSSKEENESKTKEAIEGGVVNESVVINIEDENGNEKEKRGFNRTDPGFKALARIARLCSRAKFKTLQNDVPIFRREVNGDASESAILRFMESQFKNVKKFRSRFRKFCEIPFNPRTKYQVFVHEITEKNQPVHLCTMKGAPEKVLKLCNRILINEQELPLTDQWRCKVEKAINSLGSLGERVIGFADIILPSEKYNENYVYTAEKPEFLNEGLRFVGLMSMIDPPRAAVPDAIRKCRSAGVKTVMITGDHPTTAVAIGRVVGVVSETSETLDEICARKQLSIDQISPAKVNLLVITGSELKRMDEVALSAAVTSTKDLIFARTTPELKYRIVEAFQKLGHLTTFVGDGVNDSPALKKADVAVTMGITGTEVSKAISDMVLLDDNFTSLVTGIEEGRLGFENLKKILAYSLADNVAEMYCFIIGILLDIPQPLGTMAILLTVLGTDIFPAASLMFETPETDVMKMKPRNTTKEKLITPQLLAHVYAQVAVLQAAAGYFSYFATMASFGFMPWSLIGIHKKWENSFVNDLEDSFGQEWHYYGRKRLERYAQTAFFVSIVVMQVANVIICKARRQSILQKKMSNWTMNIAILLEIGLTCAIIYVKPLARFFGMIGLMGTEWILPLPFAFLLIIFDEMRRFFLRRCNPQIGCSDDYRKMLEV